MQIDKSLEERLASGNYFEKQFLCKNSLIAWSHMRRFKIALQLVNQFALNHKRLLDYGCGDGTFLAFSLASFEEVMGVDSSPIQIESNQIRFKGMDRVKFQTVEQFSLHSSGNQFDVVTCMEVLEHCVREDVQKVIKNLSLHLSPQGTLLISVPIEIGPALIIKQSARALAALRNLGDYRYRETYTWRELWKMFFANENSSIVRPHYENLLPDGKTLMFHGHKGFNWKKFKKELETHFVVKKIHFSPLSFAPGALNSQAFFICQSKK